MSSQTEEITAALRRILPETFHAQILSLVTLIEEAINSNECSTSNIITDPKIALLLAQLAGKQIQTNTSVLSFGEANNFGDVSFRDVIAGDSIQFNLHFPLPSIFRTPTQYHLLGLCAVARAPLSISDLQSIAPEIFKRKMDIQEASQHCYPHVIGDGTINNGYRFAIPREQELFVSNALSEKEQMEFEQYFVSWGKKLLEEPEMNVPAYLRDYLIYHTTALASKNKEVIEIADAIITKTISTRKGNRLWWANIRFIAEGDFDGFLKDINLYWQYANNEFDIERCLIAAIVRSYYCKRSSALNSKVISARWGLIELLCALAPYLEANFRQEICIYVWNHSSEVKDALRKSQLLASLLRYQQATAHRKNCDYILDTVKDISCSGCTYQREKCRLCSIKRAKILTDLYPYLNDFHLRWKASGIIEDIKHHDIRDGFPWPIQSRLHVILTTIGEIYCEISTRISDSSEAFAERIGRGIFPAMFRWVLMATRTTDNAVLAICETVKSLWEAIKITIRSGKHAFSWLSYWRRGGFRERLRLSINNRRAAEPLGFAERTLPNALYSLANFLGAIYKFVIHFVFWSFSLIIRLFRFLYSAISLVITSERRRSFARRIGTIRSNKSGEQLVLEIVAELEKARQVLNISLGKAEVEAVFIIQDEQLRVECLSNLIPYLSNSEVAHVTNKTLSIVDEEQRFFLLSLLGGSIPNESVNPILEQVYTTSKVLWRVEALAALAPNLREWAITNPTYATIMWIDTIRRFNTNQPEHFLLSIAPLIPVFAKISSRRHITQIYLFIKRFMIIPDK